MKARYIELRRPYPVVYDLRKWALCHRCDRPIERRWYHRSLKPRCGPETAEVQRCAEIAAAWRSAPPEWDYDPGLRPEEDRPPKDWAMCGQCGGSGEVFLRQDYETGAMHTTDCSPCQGTGYAYGEVPGWTLLPRTT